MKQLISTAKQLGQLLQGARKSRDVSQEQLAHLSGISQARISFGELNAGRIPVERLLKILSSLELELVVQDKNASDSISTKSQLEW